MMWPYHLSSSGNLNVDSIPLAHCLCLTNVYEFAISLHDPTIIFESLVSGVQVCLPARGKFPHFHPGCLQHEIRAAPRLGGSNP